LSRLPSCSRLLTRFSASRKLANYLVCRQKSQDVPRQFKTSFKTSRDVRDVPPIAPPWRYEPANPAVPETAATGSPRVLTRDDVITAVEVSDLLDLPVSTVYQLAPEGELPARRRAHVAAPPSEHHGATR
jgi:hypothetical protein